MKNLLLIVFYLSLYNSVALSQLSKAYKFYDKNYFYRFDLYKNGMYELVLCDYETDDIIFLILLSYGKYYLNNNQLECVDNYNGYTMKFTYPKDYISAIQSFDWLKKKRIEWIGDNPGESIYMQYQKSSIKQLKAKFKQQNVKNSKLDCREYKVGGFSLILNKDSTYVYSYKRLNLSNGTWKRHGNEITLYDPSLKHIFYVFIDNNILLNTFLPGEYEEYRR